MKLAEMFITLVSTKLVFFIAVAHVLLFLWQLKSFHCNGKSENWHLLLFHCRYFDKSFSEMFIEWSSTKHTILVLTSQFDWLSWQLKD